MIGHVTTWGIHCGIARHLAYWLPRLPASRRSVVLAEDPPQWMQPVEAWPGPRAVTCWRRGSGDLVELQNAATNAGIHILHLQWDPSFWAWKSLADLGQWARVHGVKVVATVHVVVGRGEYEYAEKTLLRIADRIACGTPAMVEGLKTLADRYHIPAPPISEISLPAIPEACDTAMEFVPDDPPICLTWGMPGHIKRIEATAEAVERLRLNGRQTLRLVVMGRGVTGEQRQVIERLRAKAGKGLEVREGWFPERDLAQACMEASVIVLNHAPDNVSSSGTVVSSLASGRPVVCAAAPMFSGLEPYVVTPADESVAALAAAIDLALGTPDRFRAQRAAVLARVRPDRVALQYEALYASLATPVAECGAPTPELQTPTPELLPGPSAPAAPARPEPGSVDEVVDLLRQAADHRDRAGRLLAEGQAEKIKAIHFLDQAEAAIRERREAIER